MTPPGRDQATIVRWEDPPGPRRETSRRGPRSRYAELAEQLRGNPGRWAVILETPQRGQSALATQIRMGGLTCFTPCGDFDARTIRANGITTIYARYVGD